MSKIFTKDNIFLNEDLKTQDDVLRYVASKAQELQIGTKDVVYQAFKQREVAASTGMQDGIAMPHAISEKIKRAAVIYVGLEKPLNDWMTFDDTKVDKIIAMLVPSNGTKKHLEIISEFATSLVDEEKRKKLSKLNTVEAVYDFLKINEEE